MSERKISVSVTLPWWLWNRLDIKARILARPKVELIREAIEKALTEEDEDGKPQERKKP